MCDLRCLISILAKGNRARICCPPLNLDSYSFLFLFLGKTLCYIYPNTWLCLFIFYLRHFRKIWNSCPSFPQIKFILGDQVHLTSIAWLCCVMMFDTAYILLHLSCGFNFIIPCPFVVHLIDKSFFFRSTLF
jgi:hypothetical protein